MNSEELLHCAIFDALYLGRRLESTDLLDFTVQELHMFSYLGCLLALYEGHSVAEWKYGYILNGLSPFSARLQLAIDALKRNGSIQGNYEYFRIDEQAGQKVEELKMLNLYSWRSDYLDAACALLKVKPIGLLHDLLRYEPDMKSAILIRNKRSLLGDTPAFDTLYRQFDSIRDVIGCRNTFVAALAWTTVLEAARDAEGVCYGN